jgi:ribonuclease HII
MNYLAGVDEAGLGPVLGPLVVAGVALLGPAGQDPWKLLRKCVSKHKNERGKLRVADSKKVYLGNDGLARLERTALAFMTAWRGCAPATLEQLLAAFEADLGRLRACPWYADLALPLPLAADRGEVELQAHLLNQQLVKAEIRVHHLAARAVDADEFNDLIARTDNKSRAHFKPYGQVIAALLRQRPADVPGHLVADRCGGIVHYVPSLRRAYPGVRIETLQETELLSTYQIATRNGPMQLSFAVEGEQRSFPTALASCIAKYVRELMVHLLNRWFQARMPGLRPTAGYYQDGHRFLEEVHPIVASGEFARSLLVRVR